MSGLRRHTTLTRFQRPYKIRLDEEQETLDLSDGYLTRAATLFVAANQFDMVSNVNYLLGYNKVLRGDPQGACPFYDRALAASREFATRQPGAAVILPSGVHSMAEGLDGAKRRAGCPT
jgi:hypothetical protein